MLRDYQTEICGKVEDALKKERSVMMQMPTGTGKTVVLAELVKRQLNCITDSRDDECRVLIVAHRIELIEQTGEFLTRHGIDYGVIAGGRWPKTRKAVMVASVQTLARVIGEICCNKLNAKGSSSGFMLSPSLVIIDEAHHAVAKTYRMLWEAWPEARFLGLTATPYRMSGEGFSDLFDVLVMSWNMRRFVAEGWLATFDYYSIRPDSEQQQVIDRMKKRGADGDYQVKELRDKLDVRPSIERLFETFEKYAFDKKGIVYAIDIAHAEHIAEFYRSQGVKAQAISSKTPADVRKEMIKGFKYNRNLNLNHNSNGDIQVLVSVDLFSEGFDCPDVEFIQIARPTLSLAKYLQMVGRGLRPNKGKTSCIILDNVGLYRTFGLPTSDRDWEGYFLGDADDMAAIGDESKAMGVLRFSPTDIMGDTDEDREVVRIVRHDELAARFVNTVSDGFIRKKKGKTWVCMDTVTGIEFERHPRVIEYRGMEMVTADSETYYPRISSKWIDANHGINVKALETQTGDGLSWKMMYVSLSNPEKVYKLQEVMYNDMRIYMDEAGETYFQQDLDHPLVSENEAGGWQAFLDVCERKKEEWQMAVEKVKYHFIDKDFTTSEWQKEHKATVEKDGEFYRVCYEEQGERKEVWADKDTGFYYMHRPILRRRGFVELLHDGDMVFVRNIFHERYIPYRNWEIKADGRLCAIGNRLYRREKANAEGYRIVRRSSDFMMFVVQGNTPKTNSLTYTVINKMGMDVEIRESE